MAKGAFKQIANKAAETLKQQHKAVAQCLNTTNKRSPSPLGFVEVIIQKIEPSLRFDFLHISLEKGKEDKERNKAKVPADTIDDSVTAHNLIQLAKDKGHKDVFNYFERIVSEGFYTNGLFHQFLYRAFKAIAEKNADELETILDTVPLSVRQQFLKTPWRAVEDAVKNKEKHEIGMAAIAGYVPPNPKSTLLNYGKALQKAVIEEAKKETKPPQNPGESPLDYIARIQKWSKQAVQTPYNASIRVLQQALQGVAQKEPQSAVPESKEKRRERTKNKYYQALIAGDIEKIKEHIKEKKHYCTDYMLKDYQYTALYIALNSEYVVNNRWAVASLLVDNMAPKDLTYIHPDDNLSYLDLATSLLQAPNQTNTFYEEGKVFVKQLQCVVNQHKNNLQNRAKANGLLNESAVKHDGLCFQEGYFFNKMNKADFKQSENHNSVDLNTLVHQQPAMLEEEALKQLKKIEKTSPGALFSFHTTQGSVLHWAVRHQYGSIVDYLIKIWLDQYIKTKPSFLLLKDEQDHTAATLATERNAFTIASRLSALIMEQCTDSEAGNCLFSLIRWANGQQDAIKKAQDQEKVEKERLYAMELRNKLNEILKEQLDIVTSMSGVNLYGQTPLHLAAKHGHHAIVAFLLPYGAQQATAQGHGHPLLTLDNSYRTPAQLAKDHHHDILARWLHLHEAYYDCKRALKDNGYCTLTNSQTWQGEKQSFLFLNASDVDMEPVDKGAAFYSHLYFKRLEVALLVLLGITLPATVLLGLIVAPVATALTFYVLFHVTPLAAFIPTVFVTAVPLLVTSILAVPTLSLLFMTQVAVILATLEAAVEIGLRVVYDLCVNRVGPYLWKKIRSPLDSINEGRMVKQLDKQFKGSVYNELYEKISNEMQKDVVAASGSKQSLFIYEETVEKLFWTDPQGQAHTLVQTFRGLEKDEACRGPLVSRAQ